MFCFFKFALALPDTLDSQQVKYRNLAAIGCRNALRSQRFWQAEAQASPPGYRPDAPTYNFDPVDRVVLPKGPIGGTYRALRLQQPLTTIPMNPLLILFILRHASR